MKEIRENNIPRINSVGMSQIDQEGVMWVFHDKRY